MCRADCFSKILIQTPIIDGERKLGKKVLRGAAKAALDTKAVREIKVRAVAQIRQASVPYLIIILLGSFCLSVRGQFIEKR